MYTNIAHPAEIAELLARARVSVEQARWTCSRAVELHILAADAVREAVDTREGNY
jgi:hypothetical protein